MKINFEKRNAMAEEMRGVLEYLQESKTYRGKKALRKIITGLYETYEVVFGEGKREWGLHFNSELVAVSVVLNSKGYIKSFEVR